MSQAADTYLLLRAFVEELTRCGLRAACTSPGSRCTPIVLTLVRESRLACYSHIDERCSGFFALGLAKASGLPVAITCTSGTAAAELYPAVIEAHQARVPLIVLSADRPPELRENGAGQTIDQIQLFGGAAKWFFEVGTHEASPQRLRWIRTLACRAYWTALQGTPGVVHLNFPLREPLILEQPLPDEHSARPGGEPYLTRPTPCAASTTQTSQLSELVGASRRGVVIAGRHERPAELARAVSEFCARASWPLLADPLSGARRGVGAVAHYDALLRQQHFARSKRPDLVIRVGDLPTSKPLRAWLSNLTDMPQVALDPEAAWQDPDSVLTHSFVMDPADVFQALPSPRKTDPDWLASWSTADQLAARATHGVLAHDQLSEPLLASELGILLPERATLFVASSMPVRDIESFWPVRDDPPRVLCNRGANGIDGIVSSAFGAAASCDGPALLLIGDVALAHDIGGLLAARRLGLNLTIVLVDNNGGGIFDFLAVSSDPMALDGEHYSTHIATPTGLEFARAAELYGLAHESVHDLPGLRLALERALERTGAGIIQVNTERQHNVALHRRVWQAVGEAVAPHDVGACAQVPDIGMAGGPHPK